MRVLDSNESAVLFAFAGSLIFVGVCTLAWPWWRTVMGRTVVSISIAILVALLPSVLHYLLGVNTSEPWFAVYYRVSLGVVGLIEIRRALTVWREQRRSTDA